MLEYDKEYGQCVFCNRVFIVSLFSTSWCAYDRSGLVRIGKDYPTGVVPKGDRAYG